MSRVVLAITCAVLAQGCEGTVGPCAGAGCPHVPGCEGDNPVTCDPDHICTEQVCDGVAWICGFTAVGEYEWLRSRAPCDDGDTCTHHDLCIEGTCRGTALACDQPPPNDCIDSSTLRAWDAQGSCQDGRCVYPSHEIACPEGCQGGKCLGAPCTGVTCKNPPECFKPGVCDENTGKCVYDPEPQGASCDPKDPCVQGATCDENQKCTGGVVDCSRPNTTGGTCVAGACQGFKCDSGYGNCNSTWDDGCEVDLQDSLKHCGKCGNACGKVKNGSATCVSGKCVAKCNSPYADCDKKFANGCEIPVGVADKCSRSGLASFTGNTPPCGTAHCGSHKTDDSHQDFGTWHCTFCSHCHLFPDGGSWCLYGTSSDGKYSPQRCSSCCNPTSYPSVCK
jgi:hypothetical protein